MLAPQSLRFQCSGWDGFFHVFGICRKRVASFEEPAKKLGYRRGLMDLFWKGIQPGLRWADVGRARTLQAVRFCDP